MKQIVLKLALSSSMVALSSCEPQLNPDFTSTTNKVLEALAWKDAPAQPPLDVAIACVQPACTHESMKRLSKPIVDAVAQRPGSRIVLVGQVGEDVSSISILADIEIGTGPSVPPQARDRFIAQERTRAIAAIEEGMQMLPKKPAKDSPILETLSSVALVPTTLPRTLVIVSDLQEQSTILDMRTYTVTQETFLQTVFRAQLLHINMLADTRVVFVIPPATSSPHPLTERRDQTGMIQHRRQCQRLWRQFMAMAGARIVVFTPDLPPPSVWLPDAGGDQ